MTTTTPRQPKPDADRGAGEAMLDRGSADPARNGEDTVNTNDLQEITRILTEFAATKFSAQVLAVTGPIHEGASYIWRIVSNRYKEVTVVVKTNSSMFRKPTLSSIEVYGLGESKASKPNLQELKAFLGQAELSEVR
jgi:hypothetical protein